MHLSHQFCNLPQVDLFWLATKAVTERCKRESIQREGGAKWDSARERESAKARERGRGGERERERSCVCVCVCMLFVSEWMTD